MAIFYMRTSLVRASSGKSAVASSAYQSGVTLKSERTGQTYSYDTKEEVFHSEILLPKNAPAVYADRAALWNAVEKSQDKVNSRYARQFIIATPREWSSEETVERARKFIQANFVDAGMAVDWAFHNKQGNPHLHVMTTVRGFKADGSWDVTKRMTFALDADGNRIPVIDPETGEQKVRIRNRNGAISKEKLWERVTIPCNNWNSKAQLRQPYLQRKTAGSYGKVI